MTKAMTQDIKLSKQEAFEIKYIFNTSAIRH